MVEGDVTAPAGLSPARVYSEAVAAARDIYKTATEENASAALPWPESVVRSILKLLNAGDQDILALADRSMSDHFLFGHVPNVVIFSLRLGRETSVSDEDLVTLGLAAFLHDLGLANHLDLAAKTDKITNEEFQQLRGHVEEGLKILDLFPIPDGEIKATIRRAIAETHERLAGQGYPGRLTQAHIHPFAKIIGLAEVYEALTHVRPWRDRMIPHEALRHLMEKNDAQFDAGLIRALVEALSLYPPGSYVRLNTGDIGRVTVTNAGLPLRPRVYLMLDSDGQPLAAPRMVNLASRPTVYIEEAVDETKMKVNHPRLALELRARRWWVKGL